MITSANQNIIDNLLSLPDAPIILNQVGLKLEEEKKKRAKFYNDIDDDVKAEFINGEIVVHSPVKKEHNDVTGLLFQLMSPFVRKHKLGYVGYEKIMISLTRNDYEPDLCFFNKEKSKEFKVGQSLFPVPDLVVEVLSKGTMKNDRGIKFIDYQAHKITEYWLIDPINEVLEQYRLNGEEQYELIFKGSNGLISCQPIEGFSIPIEALFDEDKNMEVLIAISG